MAIVKLATPEEIETIKATSDLDFATGVWASHHKDGKVDIAVTKMVPEMDPVYFSPASDNRRKVDFISSLENMLRAVGIKAYYFNVSAEEKGKAWVEICKAWGAEQLSPGPELRFKKLL